METVDWGSSQWLGIDPKSLFLFLVYTFIVYILAAIL